VDGVCAYIEPTLLAADALESAVPKNFNLITYEGVNMGRQSYYGQGAGQMPTAANVVQDCLTILSGEHRFYTDKAAAMALDGKDEAHPYYVRTARSDKWLEENTAERWPTGVVTGAVNTYEMLAWAKKQLSVDPDLFIAGIV
jgi:homoserine dehydrogenase